MYSDTEIYIESINDKENRRDFVEVAQSYKQKLFEQRPNFLEEITTFNVYDYLKDDGEDIYLMFLSTIYALVNSLEVDYDDKLASDLFDAIANSLLPTDKKNILLFNIVAFTNFRPTAEQEKYLTKKCFRDASFEGTLEDLYASKEKTMAIVNDLFDKEQLQLPNF